MKIFVRVLVEIRKYLGIVLLAIVVLLGLSILKSLNYKEYDVRAAKGSFPDVTTVQEVEVLAVELVEQMTLEEKLDQSGKKRKIGYPTLGSFGRTKGCRSSERQHCLPLCHGQGGQLGYRHGTEGW